MYFANLRISDQKVIALVDFVEKTFWPVSDMVPEFDGDMVQLINEYDQIKTRFIPNGTGRPLADASTLAPIDQPRRNIFCVGKNYHEHATEFSKSGFDSSAKDGEESPDEPIFFTKPHSSIVGPDVTVASHSHVTSQLDYEAELAVVIGKAGRGIKKENAWEHVFGYTIVNDLTARDLQKRHRQWFLGKSLDGFCPMGPYLVTADTVDVESLQITCEVNGELRQKARISELIFQIPDLIETLSAGIELQPGDVIATGTPAGVGLGYNPPKFLQPGDVVSVEIERLGTLTNTIG